MNLGVMELFCSGARQVYVDNNLFPYGSKLNEQLTKVEPYVVIYDDVNIGANCIIAAHSVIFPRTKIGDNVLIATHCCLQGDCEIGDNTTIHWNAEITKGVKIGSNCFIGPRFRCSNTKQITRGKHGTLTEGEPLIEGVIVGDGTVIGGDVRCIPGITIGKNCVIDQDCLITKDIPNGSHVRGGKDKVGRMVGSWDKDGVYTKFGVWE